MGGPGSGRRWKFGAKSTTADYTSMDVRTWQRQGILRPGISFTSKWSRNSEVYASVDVRTEAQSVVLKYSHRRGDGERKAEEYPVQIEWTRCTYGGRRAWFLCPALGCGRRVAVLYGGAIFACRHCYKLVYRCQREDSLFRAIRRGDKIRDRLGCKPGMLNGPGGKPKGMHLRTFLQHLRMHQKYLWQSVPPRFRRHRHGSEPNLFLATRSARDGQTAD
jgi:hypothetical protein